MPKSHKQCEFTKNMRFLQLFDNCKNEELENSVKEKLK